MKGMEEKVHENSAEPSKARKQADVAKSWILGLKEYRKPLCHLHTQFKEAFASS